MATSSGKPTDSNGGASAKDKEAELAAKLAAFESEIAALGAVTAAAASSGAASGAGAGSTGDGVASAPAKPGAAGPAAVKQGRSDDEGSAQPAKKPRIVTSVVASAAPAGPSRPPSGYQSGGIGGAVSGGHTTESLLAMAGYVNPAAGAPGAAAAAPGTGALGAAGGVSRAPGASGGSVPARRGGTFIRTVAGKTWEDKTLAEVRSQLRRPPQPKRSDTAQPSSCVQWPANDFRLFVGNVAPDCTEPMLTRLFSKVRKSLQHVRTLLRSTHAGCSCSIRASRNARSCTVASPRRPATLGLCLSLTPPMRPRPCASLMASSLRSRCNAARSDGCWHACRQVCGIAPHQIDEEQVEGP